MKQYFKELENLKSKSLYRHLRDIQQYGPARIFLDNRPLINFSSNDYLGLSVHPRLKEAAKKALNKWGAGGNSSRLVSGHTSLHKELEEKLSELKKTEAALTFTTGYQANLSIISSLVGRDDIIISDKYNHASIVDGCILSRAKIKRYRHKDIKDLKRVLEKNSPNKKILIITDTIFSMDGDIASLKEIVSLARDNSCLLMVDEAHATGVFGKRGSGIVEHFNLKGDDALIQMGTLSKALGSLGGYIAAKKEIINYIINKGRAFIYTTALPPINVACAIEALNIIQDEPQIRKKLEENSLKTREGLKNIGFNIMDSQSQIIPILVEDSASAVKFAEQLIEQGIFVIPIRPPTVPEGTSRIRLSLTAAHSDEDIEKSLEILKKIGKEMGVV
jgi:8-amino-7-oxononanoate synthase